MITVVSTGYNAPTKALCLASVAAQRSVGFVHHYIEASEQKMPLSCIENQLAAIWDTSDDTIIVMLDGDDELAHPDVLARIEALYIDRPETWLTYGSYRFADGRPGHAREYRSDKYRLEPWLGTHLKTFRAKLAHHLEPERDLKTQSGHWRHLAVDQALMIPMLEMAGPKHSLFLSEILYVYHLETSFEFRATAHELAMEAAMVRDLRSQEPRRRLGSL